MLENGNPEELDEKEKSNHPGFLQKQLIFTLVTSVLSSCSYLVLC